MRRGLLILLGLLVLTWFEFQVYPGHSYLKGETQLLVPMLERLDTPGFLSRDLVASNPTFALTIYDEITQLLHAAGRFPFDQALIGQQVFFRFLALLGIFLLARALQVAWPSALLLSGVVNAVAHLAAPNAYVTNPEATPVSFALSLIFLAAGLLAHRKPLLSGLAAGLALLYDPVTAAAFWLLIIVMWLADPALRRLLRPKWPALIIFALILGNLEQLQVGLGAAHDLTARLSLAMVSLTQIRTPWAWVESWLANEIWSYLFLFVSGVWAISIIWRLTDRLTKWIAIGLSCAGLVSVAVAAILLHFKAQFATEMPPSQNLSLTVAFSVLLCGAAGFHAANQKRWRESLPLAALILATLMNAQVLDLLHLKVDFPARAVQDTDLNDMADWAQKSTWGSSMFQFPDIGKSMEPGTFRAISRRSLWADWESGMIAATSDLAGQEWWKRWQATMSSPYSASRLQEMLPLPIDYYVLQRTHELEGIKTAYSNSTYVVYDAQDLREVHGSLKAKR